MTLYHFTECGLDNVWLKNGFTIKETPFGPAVSFAALEQLLDEIAAHLVISPATAKTHISRSMTKLHARDRAQLVVFAYQAGLVTPGGG